MDASRGAADLSLMEMMPKIKNEGSGINGRPQQWLQSLEPQQYLAPSDPRPWMQVEEVLLVLQKRRQSHIKWLHLRVPSERVSLQCRSYVVDPRKWVRPTALDTCVNSAKECKFNRNRVKSPI